MELPAGPLKGGGQGANMPRGSEFLLTGLAARTTGTSRFIDSFSVNGWNHKRQSKTYAGFQIEYVSNKVQNRLLTISFRALADLTNLDCSSIIILNPQKTFLNNIIQLPALGRNTAVLNTSLHHLNETIVRNLKHFQIPNCQVQTSCGFKGPSIYYVCT